MKKTLLLLAFPFALKAQTLGEMRVGLNMKTKDPLITIGLSRQINKFSATTEMQINAGNDQPVNFGLRIGYSPLEFIEFGGGYHYMLYSVDGKLNEMYKLNTFAPSGYLNLYKKLYGQTFFLQTEYLRQIKFSIGVKANL